MSVDNFVTPNKDYETIKNTVLTNLVKMISYRKWLKKEKKLPVELTTRNYHHTFDYHFQQKHKKSLPLLYN